MLFKNAQPEQSAEKTTELLSVSTAMHVFFFSSADGTADICKSKGHSWVTSQVMESNNIYYVSPVWTT